MNPFFLRWHFRCSSLLPSSFPQTWTSQNTVPKCYVSGSCCCRRYILVESWHCWCNMSKDTSWRSSFCNYTTVVFGIIFKSTGSVKFSLFSINPGLTWHFVLAGLNWKVLNHIIAFNKKDAWLWIMEESHSPICRIAQPVVSSVALFSPTSSALLNWLFSHSVTCLLESILLWMEHFTCMLPSLAEVSSQDLCKIDLISQRVWMELSWCGTQWPQLASANVLVVILWPLSPKWGNGESLLQLWGMSPVGKRRKQVRFPSLHRWKDKPQVHPRGHSFSRTLETHSN